MKRWEHENQIFKNGITRETGTCKTRPIKYKLMKTSLSIIVQIGILYSITTRINDNQEDMNWNKEKEENPYLSALTDPFVDRGLQPRVHKLISTHLSITIIPLCRYI